MGGFVGALTATATGLSNRAEHRLGTNPRVSDTDGDGLSDGEEVLGTETDPNEVDTDADGVDDGNDDCPNVANSDQADNDTDGRGDACDSNGGAGQVDDADGDGAMDDVDNCANDVR